MFVEEDRQGGFSQANDNEGRRCSFRIQVPGSTI